VAKSYFFIVEISLKLGIQFSTAMAMPEPHESIFAVTGK
jgi:hypothetical protein